MRVKKNLFYLQVCSKKDPYAELYEKQKTAFTGIFKLSDLIGNVKEDMKPVKSKKPCKRKKRRKDSLEDDCVSAVSDKEQDFEEKLQDSQALDQSQDKEFDQKQSRNSDSDKQQSSHRRLSLPPPLQQNYPTPSNECRKESSIQVKPQESNKITNQHSVNWHRSQILQNYSSGLKHHEEASQQYRIQSDNRQDFPQSKGNLQHRSLSKQPCDLISVLKDLTDIKEMSGVKSSIALLLANSVANKMDNNPQVAIFQKPDNIVALKMLHEKLIRLMGSDTRNVPVNITRCFDTIKSMLSTIVTDIFYGIDVFTVIERVGNRQIILSRLNESLVRLSGERNLQNLKDNIFQVVNSLCIPECSQSLNNHRSHKEVNTSHQVSDVSSFDKETVRRSNSNDRNNFVSSKNSEENRPMPLSRTEQENAALVPSYREPRQDSRTNTAQLCMSGVGHLMTHLSANKGQSVSFEQSEPECSTSVPKYVRQLPPPGSPARHPLMESLVHHGTDHSQLTSDNSRLRAEHGSRRQELLPCYIDNRHSPLRSTFIHSHSYSPCDASGASHLPANGRLPTDLVHQAACSSSVGHPSHREFGRDNRHSHSNLVGGFRNPDNSNNLYKHRDDREFASRESRASRHGVYRTSRSVEVHDEMNRRVSEPDKTLSSENRKSLTDMLKESWS